VCLKERVQEKKKKTYVRPVSEFKSVQTLPVKIKRMFLNWEFNHLPQLSSSELSPQSFSPSQMKAGRAQSPVPH
jgi:hypothetical protein